VRMLAHRPTRVPGTLTASGFLAPSRERILGAVLCVLGGSAVSAFLQRAIGPWSVLA
jgi:hypothetical protein